MSVASIDPFYFEVLGAPTLAGRGLRPGDLGRGGCAMIVDQGFVDHVLLSRNPLDRRLRFVDTRNSDSSSAADSRP